MILNTDSLFKKYSNLIALNRLSIEVEKGVVYGVLGPNGSGKTTTLGILLGVTNATSGKYSWFSSTNASSDRKKIGALLETPNFYPNLNAWDNLSITCKIKQVPTDDIHRVAELVGLSDRIFDKFKTYSLGMKQRLAIGAALLGKPEVLVLDEPTNGLDPKGIVEIRNLIKSISKQGVTILLASHALDEVEKVCSHVCVIQKGKKITEGSVSELVVSENLVELSSENMDSLEKDCLSFSDTLNCKKEGAVLVIKLSENTKPIELNKYLIKQGVVVNHFIPRKKNLEEFFLEKTK
ncbi:MAG: ABC transporter ATP-binding protein [Crocinitomicaceae bacterium]|nr:ABC transporter ATP-binding protein [Crocinitomicaceae bacterium]